MWRMYSRRKLLKHSAGVAVGSFGVVIMGDGVAFAAAPPGAQVAKVVRATGPTVEVRLDSGRITRLPTEGFPPKWHLRPGDGVMVMNADLDGTPEVVIPLVTTISGPFRDGQGREVSVAGKPLQVRKETIRTGEAMLDGSHADAFCIQNTAENSLTAVAIRFQH